METVKEFFESIKGQLAERFANPFTGAFCIAWVLWNVRLLMVVVGKGTYQEKFAYIDTSLYLDWSYWMVRGAVLPTITAALYLWLYPRATRWLAEDYRKQQTKANNLMKAASGEQLLSVEESRSLRTRFAEAEQRWFKERDLLNLEVDGERVTTVSLAQKNDELRAQNAQLQASQAASSSSSSEPGESTGHRVNFPNQFRMGRGMRAVLGNDLGVEIYTRSQLRILSLLRDGKECSVNDIATRFKMELFEVRRAIDRMLYLELVQVDEHDEYSIGAKGRAVLGAFVDDGQWDFAAEGM